MEHYVYLEQLKDSRIYTGETSNPWQREKQHIKGKGGKTTSTFGGEQIIYCG